MFEGSTEERALLDRGPEPDPLYTSLRTEVKRKNRTTARQNAHNPRRIPLTGGADLGAPDLAGADGLAGAAGLAGGAGTSSGAAPSVGSAPPSARMFASRHDANSPVSRWEMSPIMPRPYCATAPVIVRSVPMVTCVPPSAVAWRVEVDRAVAAPLPRCSRPSAFRATRWFASSRSSMVTVPANDRLTGPIFIATLPFHV